MLKKSFFLSENAYNRYSGELHFYIASGILLALSGVIMIMIPDLTNNLILVVSLSWLLLLCAFLSFIRPFIYGRGFADMVMGICTGLFYAVVSLSASSSNIQAIDGSRFILSFILFFSGVSCLLAFSSFIHIITLPFLVMTGIAELICGILLLTGEPNYNVVYIYWLVGLMLIMSGFDYFTQGKILAQLRDKSKIQL
jgi:hypothetical protein